MSSVRLIQPPGCVASPRVLFAGCPPMPRTSKSRDRELRRISSPAALRTSAMPVLSGPRVQLSRPLPQMCESRPIDLRPTRRPRSLPADRRSRCRPLQRHLCRPDPALSPRTVWAMPFSLATTVFAFLRPGSSLSANTTPRLDLGHARGRVFALAYGRGEDVVPKEGDLLLQWPPGVDHAVDPMRLPRAVRIGIVQLEVVTPE